MDHADGAAGIVITSMQRAVESITRDAALRAQSFRLTLDLGVLQRAQAWLWVKMHQQKDLVMDKSAVVVIVIRSLSPGFAGIPNRSLRTARRSCCPATIAKWYNLS